MYIGMYVQILFYFLLEIGKNNTKNNRTRGTATFGNN